MELGNLLFNRFPCGHGCKWSPHHCSVPPSEDVQHGLGMGKGVEKADLPPIRGTLGHYLKGTMDSKQVKRTHTCSSGA